LRRRAPGRLAALGLPAGSVLVVFGHFFFDRFDSSGFAVVLPEVQRSFHLSLSGVTTLGAVSVVGAIVVALPVSFASDARLPRVALLALATAMAGAFCLVAGLMASVVAFALARSGTAAGLRLSDPIQQSLLADYSPLERRPAVYSARELANALGGLLGPAFFGAVAAAASFRWALVAEAWPVLALAGVTLALREPPRGAQERQAAGLSAEEAAEEEERPSWAEAWQRLQAVRSLRRVWYGVPFLVGGILALGYLFPLYQARVFGWGPAERGLVASLSQLFTMAGLVAGIPLATRLVGGGRPQRLMHLLGALAVVASALLAGLAAAPDALALGATLFALSFLVATVAPGFATVFSLVLPPSARSLGFAVSALWALPGLLVLPLVGKVGDEYGLRVGILCAIPVLLVGAAIVASAGSELAADMADNVARAAAALEERRDRASGRAKALVCRGVEASYGLLPVLFGVDLDVEQGEMVAVLGTNGAGKSTLVRTITGELAPSRGAVLVHGRDVTRLPPEQTAALGVVSVPGGRGVFPGLSVRENLRVAGWLYRRQGPALKRRLEAALELFPVLAERADQPARLLSGGEQQMLTLAQALVAQPRLLLVDELSLGLAPAVVGQLVEALRGLHRAGTTVVVVEQSLDVAVSLADRAVFMERGAVVYDGPAAELARRPDLLRAVFLGAGSPGAGSPGSPGARPDGDDTGAGGARPVLEARGLTKRFGGIAAVSGLSLGVGPGEILALIGPNGAGKTTLVDLLSGFLRPDAGEVWLDGRRVTPWGPERRARAGLGRSFQTARLFGSLSVAEAVAVACERHLAVADPVSALLWLPAARDTEEAARARVAELLELTGLSAWAGRAVSELSTGLRRVLEVACALAHSPRVLLMDEPAAGLAQREAEALAGLLRWLRASTGASLVVVEHDMGLVARAADRVVAMEAGSAVADGPPEQVLSDPAVVAGYLGGAAGARPGR
jgi:ABC-type branched-subunit amino acid transport system ATPase component